jgi:hypothetical protein
MDVADTNAPTWVSETGLVVVASFGRSGYVRSPHRSDEAAAVSLNCGDIGSVIPTDAPTSEDEWTHVDAESRPAKQRHLVQDGRVPPSTIGAFLFTRPSSGGGVGDHMLLDTAASYRMNPMHFGLCARPPCP